MGPALILLAGGRSTRMGRPKHELPVGGSTLLAWQIARLRPFFAELVVVGAPAPSEARSVPDLRSHAGPLAGIEAGLGALRDERGAFVLACDMARVSPSLAGLLFQVGRGHDAAVPRTRGVAQPTCSFYAPSALPKITAFLDAGNRRVTLALDALDVRFVDDEELSAEGFRLEEFADLDTPTDYEAFLAEVRA